MADLLDQGTIAADAGFQERCMAALVAYCINTVVSEGSGVANHTARDAFALEVIGHQDQISALEVARAVLTNPTIAAEATVASLPGCTAVPDTDIEYAITTVFNDLAGVVT